MYYCNHWSWYIKIPTNNYQVLASVTKAHLSYIVYSCGSENAQALKCAKKDFISSFYPSNLLWLWKSFVHWPWWLIQDLSIDTDMRLFPIFCCSSATKPPCLSAWSILFARKQACGYLDVVFIGPSLRFLMSGLQHLINWCVTSYIPTDSLTFSS